MFYDIYELEQAHWDCYTWNKAGPIKGCIYLKAGMIGGTKHRFSLLHFLRQKLRLT